MREVHIEVVKTSQVLVMTETINADIRRQIAQVAGEDAVVAKSAPAGR